MTAVFTWLRSRLTSFDLLMLLCLLVARILLIAILAPDQSRMFNGDSPQYDCLAQSFLTSGVYHCPELGEFSDMLRPPGYPALLILTYWLFGSTSFVLAILWNIPAVLVLYLGIRRLLELLGCPRHRPVLLLFVADLGWLLYSKELVTEPVFTAVLVWAVVLLLRALQRPGLSLFAAAGLLLALAALIKPIVLYLPLLLAVLLLLRFRRIKGAALLLMVFLLGVAPWLARNYAHHGRLSFTSVQNKNLGVGHTSYIRAEVEQRSYYGAHIAVQEEIAARAATLKAPGYAQMDSLWLAYAREMIGRHPFVYAKTILKGMAITLFDPGRLVLHRTLYGGDNSKIGLTNIIATEGLWGAVLRVVSERPLMAGLLMPYLLFLLAVAMLALWGIPAFWRARPDYLLLIGLILLYLWGLGGPNGYARFRLYLWPFLLVFASFGCHSLTLLWHRLRGKSSQSG